MEALWRSKRYVHAARKRGMNWARRTTPKKSCQVRKGSSVIVRPEEPKVEDENKSVSKGRFDEILDCDESVEK